MSSAWCSRLLVTCPQPISGEHFIFHLFMFGLSLLVKIQELLLPGSSHMVQAGTVNHGIPPPWPRAWVSRILLQDLEIRRKGKRISHLSSEEAKRCELGIAIRHSSSLKRKLVWKNKVEGREENYCLVGMEFHFGKIKKFCRWMIDEQYCEYT